MNANDLTTIDQVCAFMSGTQRMVFEVAGDKQGRYDRVRRTLVKFDYSGCGKADREVLISYLMKVKEMEVLFTGKHGLPGGYAACAITYGADCFPGTCNGLFGQYPHAAPTASPLSAVTTGS